MIRFRAFDPADFPLLLDWLQRPHVKEWWDDGDDTLDKVAARYALEQQETHSFVAVRDGTDAGYFQYCRLDAGQVGVDQFLADAADLSTGLGTRCLLAFIDLVAAREAPDVISVDPHPANARAIRCYEKCGFVHDPARSTATVHSMTRGC